MVKIIAAVALPPPMHGQALVSRSVINALSAQACALVIYDLSPGRWQRGLGYHARRLKQVLHAGWALLTSRHRAQQVLYAVAEGGHGLWYTLLLVSLARLAGYRIFLHHHSAAQVRSCRLLLAGVMVIGGQSTSHVVLSNGMAADLRRVYSWFRALRIMVCSNAGYLPVDMPKLSLAAKKTKNLRLGMLGNLTADKGTLLALATLRQLVRQGCDATLTLAGPVMEPIVQRAIDTTVAEVGERVALIAAVDETDKNGFFKAVDVLLFPSRYRHEAQPLVILEALRAGVPVIAYDHGYVSELLGPPRPVPGTLIPLTEDFTETVALLLMRHTDTELAWKRQAAQQRFKRLHAASRRQMQDLITAMVAG